MTREKEDELLAELNELRRERRRLVQRIVEARANGQRDDAAIAALKALSERQLVLTGAMAIAA